MKVKTKTVMRIVLYGILALFALGGGLFQFALHYTPEPNDIICSGTSTEMGRQYGQQLSLSMKLLIKVYLEMGVCHNKPDVIKARYLAAAGVYKNLSANYQDELKAAAEAGGCSLNALTYGNCFLDIGHANAGCRSVVIKHKDVFLHGHNLDWENLGGLAKWTTSIIRRNPGDGRFKTVTIAFPGMLGSLDIINEKGIALSFNQLGFGNSIPKEPVFLTMRRIAETCETYDDVRKAIVNCPAGMPFLITASSAVEGRAAVFERLAVSVEERCLKNGWVASCNVAQRQQSDLTMLDKAIIKCTPTDRAGLQDTLSHPDVMMECNLYSVIFDFKNNRLFLASGQLPAATEAFNEFPLF